MTHADGFALELSGAPVAASPGYARALKHYVPIFERSLRLLKGWIADGRDANPPELPPLDRPEEMLAWWHRVKKNRAPDVLRRLAAAGGKSVTTPPDPAKISPTPSLVAQPAAPAAAVSVAAAPVLAASAAVATSLPALGETTGYTAMLNRLRIGEARAGALHQQLLDDALATKDPDLRLRLQAAAERAYESWTKVGGDLRRAEADAPKILSAQGKAWDGDAVLAAVEAFHLVQFSTLRGLVDRVDPLLMQCADLGARRVTWNRELDRILGTWDPEHFFDSLLRDAA